MVYLLQILLSVTAIFLILLVLVQRGRGGGLAGALGGPGGSSAFGAKAGDTFTRITIYAAAFWILLCIGAAYWAGHQGDPLLGGADVLHAPAGKADSEADTGEAEAGEAEAGEAEAGEADEAGGATDAAADALRPAGQDALTDETPADEPAPGS
ncbi:preprotein translocase subunit SecG [Pirellulimonas nuda]|uniref:Protein-export membrane protein SecG n=1 Tax=Pirellulimonas nuda TaxID=2528009 RepID=A0A518DGR7_9BACT|nr:preprotein translocase subunit SecG [Pirellulimonas nuda]QDU90669.1 preprotein translocase subunit SecG [Pirellulimonas nuda]